MKRYAGLLIGGMCGLIFSVVLFFTQSIDFTFYFTSAPYYLDALSLKSDTLVGPVTFVYFIALFAFLGFLIFSKLPRKFTLTLIIVLVLIHFSLGYYGGRRVFNGLPSALKSVSLNM